MKKNYILLMILTIGFVNGFSQTPYLGEIRIVSMSYAPKGWALCNGQLLSIAQNQALFSLLGITYGGDGRTTFALPNLQGRQAMDEGNGHVQGEKAGETEHTLTIQEIPSHTHLVSTPQLVVNASTAAGTTDIPTGNYYAKNLARGNEFSTQANSNSGTVVIPTGIITNSGGSQSHSNMAPYTVVNYIIALQGIFPSQN